MTWHISKSLEHDFSGSFRNVALPTKTDEEHIIFRPYNILLMRDIVNFKPRKSLPFIIINKSEIQVF